jgi:hypothetical protein
MGKIVEKELGKKFENKPRLRFFRCQVRVCDVQGCLINNLMRGN